MKKYIIIVAMFFPIISYGFRNLRVNGGTSATVTIEDSLRITGNFESAGATAKVIIYYDANGNGIIDEPERNYWLGKHKFIDGNFDDLDESPNGAYSTVVDPITSVGDFIIYVEDGGVSATASVKVNPITSSYSVSGTITTPANTKDLFVCVFDSIDGVEHQYGDFTDATGRFFISIPNRIGPRTWRCFAVDMLGVTPNFVSSNVAYEIAVAGAVTQNLSMLPITHTTTVLGEIRTDNNVPITDPINIICGSVTPTATRVKFTKSNVSGQFSTNFQKIHGYCMYITLPSGIAAQFYPTFMNPPYYDTLLPGGAPDQIQFKVKVYRTTNTIKGRVYKDGAPYDGAIIECSGRGIGGMYTKSYRDGRYEMPVSDSATVYTLAISPKSIPKGYRVLEGVITARPGDINKNFNIVGIEEKTNIENQILKINTGSFVYKIPYNGNVENLVIYNILGIKVAEIKPMKMEGEIQYVIGNNIPNGIYFYCINREKKGKIIKLR